MSIQQNFPAISPTLSLNFARSKKLDPRITFTRTSSATRVNEKGLIEVVPANSPRFDHSFNVSTGTISSLGLLIEESRQNLTTFSEQLDNERWTVNNLTLSSNTIETSAPDGSNNAEKVLETVTNSFHTFRNFNAYGITAGTVYTASIFVKSINKEFVQLVFDDNATTNGGYVNFNLTSGTITQSANYGTGSNIAGTITSYPNGWYRLSITSTAGTSGTFGRFAITGLTSGTSGTFPGYAGNTSNGYYIWGAQLEVGNFPTSYIPTTTSTVTRTGDIASITGSNFSDWYNSSAGSIFAQARGSIGTSFGCIATLSGSTYQTGNGFLLRQSTTTTIEHGGNASSSGVTISSSTQSFRAACAFSGTISDLSVNGNMANTLTNLDYTGSGTTTLNIGRLQPSGGQLYNGTIAQLSYYSRRLTNSQLQALTR